VVKDKEKGGVFPKKLEKDNKERLAAEKVDGDNGTGGGT